MASDELSMSTVILNSSVVVRESSLTIRTTSGGVSIISLIEYCTISKPTLTASAERREKRIRKKRYGRTNISSVINNRAGCSIPSLSRILMVIV